MTKGFVVAWDGQFVNQSNETFIAVYRLRSHAFAFSLCQVSLSFQFHLGLIRRQAVHAVAGVKKSEQTVCLWVSVFLFHVFFVVLSFKVRCFKEAVLLSVVSLHSPQIFARCASTERPVGAGIACWQERRTRD